MNQPATVPDVVLIGGCPRSGTTLLAELLNASPDVGIIFEYPLASLVRDLQPIFAYEREATRQREARRGAANVAAGDATVYVNARQFIERPRYPSRERLPAIVGGIVAASLGKGELRLIGSKTPGSNVGDLNVSLRAHFPVIQNFFLIRNPADTINSMINRRNRARLADDGWPFMDAEAAIAEYRAAVRLLLSTAYLDPERTWIVKYEDIHERSQWFVAWLAATLGIAPIDPQSDVARNILQQPLATRNVLTRTEYTLVDAECREAVAAWPAKLLTGRASAVSDALHDCVDRVYADRTYAFGSDELPKFLGLGWGEIERSGVWSDSERAFLFWSHEFDGRFELRIELDYFLPVPEFEQAFAIELNGNVVYRGRATSSNAERTIIVGPLSLQAGIVQRCVVHIDDPRSPKSFGLSQDARRLGIFLRSLRFCEVSRQ